MNPQTSDATDEDLAKEVLSLIARFQEFISAGERLVERSTVRQDRRSDAD